VPPAKVRTPELRQQLVDVTVDLLASEGAAAITTRRVASRANTSAPAIFELFGDKTGLVRALFFEGFRRLRAHLEELPPARGAVADLIEFVHTFRAFTLEHPALFEVMYNKPFEAFSPSTDERAVGDATRSILVDRTAACVQAGRLRGDPVDIAHAILALAIGLATQETAGWLGSTRRARDRRWEHGVDALLRGFGARRRTAPRRAAVRSTG
jgi:AcrR family transcriptional regulator